MTNLTAEGKRKISRLISELKKAKASQNLGTTVEFCITCGRVIGPTESFEHPAGHYTVFSDYSHDGIGSIIEMLEWMLSGKVHRVIGHDFAGQELIRLLT